MAKPDRATKEAIRDLLKNGYSIEQVQAQYPHVDGRVISGINRHLNSPAVGLFGGAPGASGFRRGPSTPVSDSPREPDDSPSVVDSAPAPKPFSSSVPTTSTMRPAKSGASSVPPPSAPPGMPDAKVRKRVAEYGFSGSGPVVSPASKYGFGAYARDEMVIYRDGSHWKTIDALPKPELIKMLPRGHVYDVELFVNKVLVHKDKIVTTGSDEDGDEGGNRQGHDNRRFVPNRSHLPGREPVNSARDASDLLRTVSEMTKSEREGLSAKESAMVTSLSDVLKSAFSGNGRHVESPKGPDVKELIVLMTAGYDKQLAMAREQHKIDMERMRVEMKMRSDESERKAELDRVRMDQEHKQRLAEQQLVYDRLMDVEKQRADTQREILDRDRKFLDDKHKDIVRGAETAFTEMKESLEKEREHYTTLMDMRLEMERKLMDQKLSSSEHGQGLEQTRMITEAINNGINGIATRIEGIAALSKGFAPPRRQAAVQENAGGEKIAVRDNGRNNVESAEIKEDLFKAKWFQDIRAEVARVIRQRQEGRRIHGSLLASVVLSEINKDPVNRRVWLYYLITRSREEVVRDAGGNLPRDESDLLLSEEGEAWFKEFQGVLADTWNAQFYGREEDQGAEDESQEGS